VIAFGATVAVRDRPSRLPDGRPTVAPPSDMRTLDPQSLTQHVDRLYRAAWALCGSREDAEDLVQETFTRVLARPRVLSGEDELYYLMRVPSESPADHAQLAVSVDGVPFPYWEDRFGWHSTGSRTDRVDGRSITTVFYSDSHGRRIGYAILAGTSAPQVAGGVIAWRGGVSYRLLTKNGAAVVTWLRDGHLCVVSGRDVSSATLLRLASWSDHDAIAS
jgi:Sigma-70 region 2